ncbi:MAG: type I restriction-modification system subunit M [Muribaculaceae bacterium]|nr:type I restriction-modification system subunit M [Muribaculaceae bacterium]
MITGQIKNQIDQIWNTFWESAGITNPMSVLEQMTYLFFMKMLDDAQLQREAIDNQLDIPHASDDTFAYGSWHNPDTGEDIPVNDLRWHVFKHFDPEKMFRHIQRNVFPYVKTLNRGEDSAYSRFMGNAFFLIASPRALVKIVDGIDTLEMNDRDTMGDVYEYILGKMAASGKNGQFRTPRHIIRMMVELMRPTLNDTVCDPAMGSAGFIVETAKYIKEHYRAELMKQHNDDHFRRSMLHGFDTDQTMLRIGAMNLMLHDINNPDVAFRDSLSSDNTDTDRYTLILANPPFAGNLDYEAVSKSLLTTAKTKKTELLFLSLFLRSLAMGGRCASIVPDGVLTGTSNAHKAIRRAIVDGNRLEAVISMPSGVFKPYAGVSTAILIFTKTGGAGGTDKVWFYDMKADGFSLDDKRNPISDNDIPDIIARFHAHVGTHPGASESPEQSRTRTDQSFLVPLDEIREHDYDLAFNTYKETIREVIEYAAPEVLISRAATLAEKITDGIASLQSLIASDHEA